MTVKKRKLKKSFKIGILCLFIVLFIVVGIKAVNLFGNDKEPDKNMTSYITKNIIDKKENAVIKISYPTFGYEEFDKMIESAVSEKEREFIQEVIDTREIAPDLIGELVIDYDVFKTDSLISVHLLFSKYLGGANYIQENKSCYFDIKSKKVISWEDLFEDPNDALRQLSSLSLKQLKNMDADLWEEKTMLDEGLMDKKENFENCFLEDHGMLILFPIYQVGPRSSGNIWIILGYDQVNSLLKKDYQGAAPLVKNESEKQEGERNLRDVSELQDKKLVALTFDDGPSYQITESLLDGLKERNAKVTFFVLGSRAEQYKDVVQRAYMDGHTIASHSYDHKNLLNLDAESLAEDLNKANKAVLDATGADPFALRPPYGNYSQEVIDASKMPVVLWNVDTEDWKNRDAEITYQNIMDHIEDGSIILMHDLYGTSVEAALKLIDDLADQGYAFVSLEELERLGRISSDADVISGFKN